MGIIKNLAKSVVKSELKRVASHGVLAAGSIAYQLSRQKVQENDRAFLKEQTDCTRLIILQELYRYKECMRVLDENEEVKYIVEGKLLSSTHQLTIYDKTKSIKLGAVKEKRFAFRSPLSLESHPQDFVIEIDGKKIGKIKSRYALGKRKFEFDFNGWTIIGDVLGKKYKVVNGKELIMTVDSKLLRAALQEDETHYVEIFNKKHELLCLLVALTIDSSQTSKSSDNARAWRHTKRKYTGFYF